MQPVLVDVRRAKDTVMHFNDIPISPLEHILGVEPVTNQKPRKNFNFQQAFTTPYLTIYLTASDLSEAMLIKTFSRINSIFPYGFPFIVPINIQNHSLN
jgi:hypothetical protein